MDAIDGAPLMPSRRTLQRLANKAKPGDAAFRIGHTFAIQGAVAVATVPGMFVSLASGETINAVKARYKIASGTNVTFKIQKNGADWTGYGTTASPLTATTTAATTTQSNALAEDDLVTLVIVAVSASPVDLAVTLFLEHV